MLGCLVAVLSLAAALPQEREWGELATTVLMIGFVMLGIPILLLTSIDVGTVLRKDREAPRWARVLGYILSVPQLALALAALGIGAAMIGWMLYLQWEVMPWYLSAAIGLGMWPTVLAFGLHLMRTTIRRCEQGPDLPDTSPAEEVIDDRT